MKFPSLSRTTVICCLSLAASFHASAQQVGSVTYTGSYQTDSSSVFVGFQNTGTLTILNGGQVSDSFRGYVGYRGDGTVLIDGVNANGTRSTWNAGDRLGIGFGGAGTVTISNGGKLSDTDGFMSYGELFRVHKSLVTVTGAGSTWENRGEVRVGETDDATLNILDGGQVSDRVGYVSLSPTTTSNVTVSGINTNGTASTWTNREGLYVGNLGSATVNIQNGGLVTAPFVLIGFNYGGQTVNLNLSTGGILETNSITIKDVKSGAINFDGGILRATADSATLVDTPVKINLRDGGGTINNGGHAVTISGAIRGTGPLVSTGTGVLTLAGTNTYTGPTTVNSGTLEFSQVAALPTTSAVAASSGATVAVRVGGAGEFTNAVSGPGSIGGVLSSVTFASGSNFGIDTVDAVAPITYAGNITQANLGITKMGPGSLILTGANTYAGGTTIQAGSLIVSQSGGLGQGGVKLAGGTLQTDNVNHVLKIKNTFTQTGGTLFLNLNGRVGAANNDQVQVNGRASLGGNLQLNYTAGALAPTDSATYLVLTTTQGITEVGAGYLTPASQQVGALIITYAGTNADGDFYVTATAKQTAFSTLPGAHYTPDALSVANYLDRFGLVGNSGPQLALWRALDAVSVDPVALNAALKQLTPLPFANFSTTTAFNNTSFTTQQFDGYLSTRRTVNGTFVATGGGIDCTGLTLNDPNVDSGLQLVHSRLLAWNPAPRRGLISDSADPILAGIDLATPASGSPAQPWNVFVAGNAILAQGYANGSPNLSDTHSTTGAMQLGADYQLTPHVIVGGLFGFSHTSGTLDNLGSKATVDTYSPGVYASYSDSGWYANALATYGFGDYSQNRNIAIGAFNGTANSSPGGGQVVANLDGGYDFHRGPWTFGPTLGLQYVHLNVDGYTETGLPGANLTVNSNEADSLRSRLGGDVRYSIQGAGVLFTPHLSASWQHEFFDSSQGITAGFAGAGPGTFVTNTPNASRDSALAGAGLDVQLDKTWTVFADYTAQVGQSNYFGQSIQGGVKIGF